MSGERIDARELSARLGHSADYWTRLARAKKVPHRRIGRDLWWTEEDVAAIVRAALVEPADPLRSQTQASRQAGRRKNRT
jgi:hypothetical protein